MPLLPASTSHIDYEKTLMSFKNTQLADEGNDQQFKRTLIDEGSADYKPADLNTGKETMHPFKRTYIPTDESNISANTIPGIQKRKLVGWLVTFSNDENGQDYKLYVGKNKIGSGEGSDILIKDHSVSGDHLLILFRENEFCSRIIILPMAQRLMVNPPPKES